MPIQSPTEQQFITLQKLFAYWNKNLFNGKLSNCILNFSRKSKAYGFFAPTRWKPNSKKDGRLHEISLNPEHLDRPLIDYMSTLVHEMCHLQQLTFGKPTPGYHNKEFAQMMKAVGLHCSNTGQPGGKETGKNMTHYIIKDGPFQKCFAKLPKELTLPFICSPEIKKPAKPGKNKTKYSCPGCDTNIWGKDGLNVECADCEEIFLAQ